MAVEFSAASSSSHSMYSGGLSSHDTNAIDVPGPKAYITNDIKRFHRIKPMV
jgi:hypothetical protein